MLDFAYAIAGWELPFPSSLPSRRQWPTSAAASTGRSSSPSISSGTTCAATAAATPGLTNFYRTFGGPLTFVVILCDVLKAVAAILFARYLFFAGYTIYLSAASTTQFWHSFSEYWAGLFCLLGHMFPCMFHFKGGKGILSGGTIAIMIDWRVALVVWGGFLILAVLTKYVSLGSVWAGASFPFATLLCVPRS